MSDHYRYEHSLTLRGVIFRCEVFKVLRETPQGYWIVRAAIMHYGEEKKETMKRWISKSSRKRYAYPTKEEAYNNVLRRKTRRLDHLKSDIKITEAMVTLLSRCTVETIEDSNQLTGIRNIEQDFY